MNLEKKLEAKNERLREQKTMLLGEVDRLATLIDSATRHYRNEIAQLETIVKTAEQSLQILRKQFATPKCPLCRQEFDMKSESRSPRILTCGHTMCRLCLCSHWECAIFFRCPLDGKVTLMPTGLSGIPVNRHLIPHIANAADR